jgi:signal transduction histidine kinase/CHASE3 domain sensor protein/ActR/RegA family two-component response regulator
VLQLTPSVPVRGNENAAITRSPASRRGGYWPWGLTAKVLLALFLAALATGAFFSYRSLEGLRTRSEWVTHTLQVRANTARLISRLQDAESNTLQYLFTGDSRYREAVNTELTNSRRQVARLGELTRDNPEQQGRLQALLTAVEAHFGELARITDAYSGGNREAALAGLAAIHSTQALEVVRKRITEIEATEQSLLSVRTQRAGDAFELVVAVGAATILSLLLLLGLFLWSAQRDLRLRRLLQYAVSESEVRQAFLLRLNDRLRTLTDPEHMQLQAARVLGEHLRASRVGYAEAEGDGEHVTVRHNYTDGVPDIAGSYRYRDFGSGLLAALRAGLTVSSSDIATDPALTELERRAYGRLEVRSKISVPLLRAGELRAVLFVHDTAARSWSDSELALVDEVAARTWDAVERAHAEKALRDANEQLRDADQRKDTFLAVLAHELRNPLAPIRNAARILQVATADKREWAAALIERQVRTMSRLLDELLDVSRIARGAFSLHPVRVRLESVIRHALETVQPGIDERRHSVSIVLRESVELECDPVRIEQVFANLLTNAAKYSAPGGRIEITISTDHRDAVISVRDSGIGFEDHAAPRLFEMFGQIGDPRERSDGGLGVGLALVKAIVELHDGSIDAHSAGLGKGSNFVVRLPLPAGSAMPVQDAEDATYAVTRPRRILIADDNQDGADSLGTSLELSGHKVLIARDGPAALDAARSFSPELAFIDIGMPGLSGYDVARAIRAAEWGRSMQLVALTGWGQDEDKRRAHAAGFDAHLTKPVDLRVLEQIVSHPHTVRRAQTH